MGGGNVDRVLSKKRITCEELDEENVEKNVKGITHVCARTHIHRNIQIHRHANTHTTTRIHIHSEFEIRDCNNSFLKQSKESYQSTCRQDKNNLNPKNIS